MTKLFYGKVWDSEATIFAAVIRAPNANQAEKYMLEYLSAMLEGDDDRFDHHIQEIDDHGTDGILLWGPVVKTTEQPSVDKPQ